jgi:nucleoside-diphosphate-sugar epimerase
VRVFALPETVKDVQHTDRVEVVTGDLANEACLSEAVHGIATVYHLGALLPGSSYNDLMRVNVHGTENLLRACRRAGGVHRFVFLSSVAVYGGPFFPRDWPLTEISPLRPWGSQSLRQYGQSKVAAESLVQRYAKDCNFAYVILRAATSYGVGGKFMQDLIRRVLADPSAGYGRGAWGPMQLIHVRDLAAIVVKAGVHPEATNEIFNVAGSEAPTYRYITTLIRRLAGLDDWMIRIPDRSRTWQRYLLAYDIAKAQRTLGFMPRVTIQEGLMELLAAIDTREAAMGTLWGNRPVW